MAKSKIAIALGGGGARGISHIGIFRALHEQGVPYDVLVGTSIGALAACEFGLDSDADVVSRRVLGYLKRASFGKYGMTLVRQPGEKTQRSFSRRIGLALLKSLAAQYMLIARSLVNPRRLYEAVDGVLPDKTFADARLPVHCVAVDVRTGKEVVISEGSMRQAVHASASLAGFFPPKKLNGMLLIDPSPICSVPVAAARSLGATHVIAVDIRSPVLPVDGPMSGGELVMRVGVLASERANDLQMEKADVLIRPDVGDVYWSDFDKLDELVRRGEAAALEAMDDIRRMLSKARRRCGKAK